MHACKMKSLKNDTEVDNKKSLKEVIRQPSIDQDFMTCPLKSKSFQTQNKNKFLF